ncbi:transposase [Streptomyces yaanensis]|uniref:Transposase n=1 Tax=Streptomyces yaanensis TaxID=1142239 RepID=A0ABV7SEI7_9ACTN|nr:transposase [Streptomyces sp. CGMCC 4.7035]WNB98232.1 transposase [Streptomyces sp. CGMCC 4.7035]
MAKKLKDSRFAPRASRCSPSTPQASDCAPNAPSGAARRALPQASAAPAPRRAEVRRLLAWLTERQVEVVVMEATADYWRSVYYLLQPHLNLMLVNPAHLKGIRRRKSNPGDAAFLGRAGASGLVMASFVPERGIREVRELTRRHTKLVRTASWEAQHLEKELEDTGMKLTSVLTDGDRHQRAGHPGGPVRRGTRPGTPGRLDRRQGPGQDPRADRGPGR